MYRYSPLSAIICMAITVPLCAQQATIGVSARGSSSAPNIVGDPGPRVGAAASSQDSQSLEFASVRQAPSFQTKLNDRPQKVLFVKSEATSAKEAIANLLLSDVGLNLITMALMPQMRMWNPYMNDSIRKGIDLGKGMLIGHGSVTKGFEYETLPGATAEVTLKEGNAEFLVPMNTYLPTADFDVAGVQPMLIKLEPRGRDNARLITSRQVVLDQNKTGRFDLKPTIERRETAIEQNLVPVTTEHLPGNVFKVIPNAPLVAGEYALVLRKTSNAGNLAENVALRPTLAARTPENPAVQRSGIFGAMGGGPSQQSAAAPSRSPFGMLRRGIAPAANVGSAANPQAGAVGFIAWDFRVLK